MSASHWSRPLGCGGERLPLTATADTAPHPRSSAIALRLGAVGGGREGRAKRPAAHGSRDDRRGTRPSRRSIRPRPASPRWTSLMLRMLPLCCAPWMRCSSAFPRCWSPTTRLSRPGSSTPPTATVGERPSHHFIDVSCGQTCVGDRGCAFVDLQRARKDRSEPHQVPSLCTRDDGRPLTRGDAPLQRTCRLWAAYTTLCHKVKGLDVRAPTQSVRSRIYDR